MSRRRRFRKIQSTNECAIVIAYSAYFFCCRSLPTSIVFASRSPARECRRILNLSPEQWGWVVGLFTLSYAAFEIPSGAMADRIGARKVLTRIVAWWSVFHEPHRRGSNYLVLLFVRFAFGAGEAGAYPGSSSAISRWFPQPNAAARMASCGWQAASAEHCHRCW